MLSGYQIERGEMTGQVARMGENVSTCGFLIGNPKVGQYLEQIE